MRKKFLLALLSVIMALSCAFAFAACKKDHVHVDANEDGYCDECQEKMPSQSGGEGGGGEDGGDDGDDADTHVHTYSDTWTYDDTNHWHQATCEHNTLLKDRKEHTYTKDYITDGPSLALGKPAVYEDVLKCPVCGYERGFEDGYEMYLYGNVASMPELQNISLSVGVIKLGNLDVSNDRTKIKEECADYKLEYNEETETFSYNGPDGNGVLLQPGDSIGFYNYQGQTYKSTDKDKNPTYYTQGSIRPYLLVDGSEEPTMMILKKGYYTLTWSPTAEGLEYSCLTVTRTYQHEHKFDGDDAATAASYGHDNTQHWKLCTEMENNGLEADAEGYAEWRCDYAEVSPMTGEVIKEDHSYDATGKCKCGYVNPEKCTHTDEKGNSLLLFGGSSRYPTNEVLNSAIKSPGGSGQWPDAGIYATCSACGHEEFFHIENYTYNAIDASIRYDSWRAVNDFYMRRDIDPDTEKKVYRDDKIQQNVTAKRTNNSEPENVGGTRNLYHKKNAQGAADVNGDYYTHWSVGDGIQKQFVLISKPGKYTFTFDKMSLGMENLGLHLMEFGAFPFRPTQNGMRLQDTEYPSSVERFEYTMGADGKPVKGSRVDVPLTIEGGAWRTEITEAELAGGTKDSSGTILNPLKDIMDYQEWRSKVEINGTNGVGFNLNFPTTNITSISFYVTQEDIDKCKPYMPTGDDLENVQPILTVAFSLLWQEKLADNTWRTVYENTETLTGMTYEEICAEHEYVVDTSKGVCVTARSPASPTETAGYEYCKVCGIGKKVENVIHWRTSHNGKDKRLYMMYDAANEGKKYYIGGATCGLQIKITQPGTYTISYETYCSLTTGAGVGDDPSIKNVPNPQYGVAYNYLAKINVGGDPVAVDRNWGDVDGDGTVSANEKKAADDAGNIGKYVGGMVAVFSGKWNAAGTFTENATTASQFGKNYTYATLTAFRNIFQINGAAATSDAGDWKNKDGDSMPINVKTISFTITAEMLATTLQGTDVSYMSNYGTDGSTGVFIFIQTQPTVSKAGSGVSGATLFTLHKS